MAHAPGGPALLLFELLFYLRSWLLLLRLVVCYLQARHPGATPQVQVGPEMGCSVQSGLRTQEHGRPVARAMAAAALAETGKCQTGMEIVKLLITC